MLRRIVIAVALITTISHAVAARLERASVVRHDASRGFASQVRQLAASGTPVWIAWDAAVFDPDSYMCCFNSIDEGEKRGWRGGRCTLAGKGGTSFINGKNDLATPIVRTTFAIFAKAEKGTISEMRTFSEDCTVDAEGMTVHYFSNVPATDGIAWLETIATDHEPRSKKDAGHAAAAIANHQAPQAVDALERLVTRAQSDQVRAKAAFWLGQRGGARGRQVLRGVIDDPRSSTHLVDQAIVGIAQDKDREATDLLLSLAKKHRSTHARKQAIFWLGQRAGAKATAHLKEATNDPDDEVREMAVFSISQLPRDQAIPELIQLAKTHKSPRVREKAIFWLGQSGDPRALDFIEEVLTKWLVVGGW